MQCRSLRDLSVAALCCLSAFAYAQTAHAVHPPAAANARNQWFSRGRIVHGKATADLRRRAYQTKLRMRAQRAAHPASSQPAALGSWTPLGPLPLASDATGNGTQDYHQVAGRATAVAIDPADPTGNTLYIGGAESGVWKSTNAAGVPASAVSWTPLTDDQPTLAIGALAIQPGNADPTRTVILAATGEANNSADSYFGLGIERSTDAGITWNLITTANSGALSLSGLGGTRMAFSHAPGQFNTVVAAMATSAEGIVEGAATANTMRGLYTSLDAGQSWTYNALTDPGGATDPASATSVVYSAGAGQFFAAVRYHGFYSSPDGITWTRLTSQPGGAMLSATVCPPQSSSNNAACPLFRAELTVVPGRKEMYAWFIYEAGGTLTDGGIWQSPDGGASWNAISESGITNCGDFAGCGVDQGAFNLEILAVPDGSGTDLYAGADNLYKCAINSQNVACASAPFLNLTHVYGCDPIAAPAHVHPAQHALDFTLPPAGGALMFFANDGGIYRALDGFAGLATGSCAGVNQFDDLNQNLGSMTQFVSFSQHPTDANTLLGGAEGNGSPATNQALTSSSWISVLGGDGGNNAIDPNAPADFYASNPDVPPGSLGIQLCSAGVNCLDGSFNFIVTSESVGGDDGAYDFPFILDPQSTDALLVGTCRVWRGSRTGGAYTALSPNFDTLGSGACSGGEINLVQALAAGGATDANGSTVIYAATSGFGPLDGPLNAPTGGHVWVTTNASAGAISFIDVTNNGPFGSINPNQYPISSVALDSSDATGATAYVTVMGFTGGPGHIWKTLNAGVTWSDFTGNLPDSPVNTALVDPTTAQIYVATDVGVFTSLTASAGWTELGPGPNQPGFLPNAVVTALGIFSSNGVRLLRASTYGRGLWQFALAAPVDFQLAISNSPLTLFSGQTAVFDGTATSAYGFSNSVALACIAGTTSPPATCNPIPGSVIPGSNGSFVVSVNGNTGDYSFNIRGTGSDANHATHSVPVVLHVVSFGLTKPSPATVTVKRGSTSAPVTFEATAAGSFNQSVTVSCTSTIPGAVCHLTPGAVVNPTSSNPVTMTAAVDVPAGTAAGGHAVTLQAATAGASANVTTDFSLNVTANPDFIVAESSAFPEVNAGSTGINGPITITAQDGFTGTVALTCSQTVGANSCSISPASVSLFPATATLTINGTSFAVGTYSINVTGISGSLSHSVTVPFNVGDFLVSGTQALTLPPGGQGTAQFTVTSTTFYAGSINFTCDASALSGATCTLAPSTPLAVTGASPGNLIASINIPNNAAAGVYNFKINLQDSTGAPSHSVTVALTVGQDFEVISTTPRQTVIAGQTSGPYNLTIEPVGSAFNAAITLSCSGLPALSQCVFAPATPITPGNSAVNAILTISTTATTTAALQRRDFAGLFYPAGLSFFGCVILWSAGASTRQRKLRRLMSVPLLALFLILLPACGGVSAGSGGHQGTQPGTYQIKITGNSPSASHSAQVALIVN